MKLFLVITFMMLSTATSFFQDYVLVTKMNEHLYIVLSSVQLLFAYIAGVIACYKGKKDDQN